MRVRVDPLHSGRKIMTYEKDLIRYKIGSLSSKDVSLKYDIGQSKVSQDAKTYMMQFDIFIQQTKLICLQFEDVVLRDNGIITYGWNASQVDDPLHWYVLYMIARNYFDDELSILEIIAFIKLVVQSYSGKEEQTRYTHILDMWSEIRDMDKFISEMKGE